MEDSRGNNNNNTERLLLHSQREDEDRDFSWRDLKRGEYLEEVKRVGWLAAPMMAVTLSQILLQVISITMVGHLGNLALSSTSLATSFCNVTGFSLIIGLASALETLSGQAYGAKIYKKLGIQMYTAMFCLTLVCLPVSIIWINIEKLLVLLGQDREIAHEARRYAMGLIPGVFSYAALQPLVRYFQTQSMIRPLLISSCATLCVHTFLSWFLVFHTGLENVGGALALSLSSWLNVVMLGLFRRYSSACSETRTPVSMEIFHGVGEFFRFGIPSAAMICLEWWSYEILILLSGLLPNPQLETSVLSLCLQTIGTLYTIPYGISAAASTRISNELGAGNPQAAQIVVYAVLSLTLTEAILVSGSLFASRHVFGYIFSNEKEVVTYIAKMAPLVSLSVIMDSLQAVLSGIARGCGWQHIGAYVNLGAFYLVGIPIAASLAFWFNLRGVGLWVGIQAGALTQTTLLSIVTGCTNWEKQAAAARERVLDDNGESHKKELLN